MSSIGSGVAGGLAFGLAFQLRDEFSGAVKSVQDSMKGLKILTTDAATKLNLHMNQLRLGALMATAGIAGLVTAIGPLQKAAEYEQLGIALRTMLGSAEDANKLMRGMDEFARTTPFEIDEVRKSGRMMVAFGKDAASVVPLLETLGNVASGVGLRLEDLAEVYGRNLSQPHLYMRDIWQITTRGIPILDELAKLLNVNKDALPKMVEQGKVTIAHMEEAFKMMGGVGGRFHNLMHEQSKSLNGMWRNFADTIHLAQQAWGMQMIPMATSLLRILIKATTAFQAFAESAFGSKVLKGITMFFIFLATLGLILMTLGGIKYVFVMLLGVFGAATKAMIVNTLVTQGWAAAWVQVGVAIRTALAPLWPWLLASAAVIGVIYAVRRALSSFDDMGHFPGGQSTGLEGFMQRIGGIIRTFIELWKTWDKTTKTSSIGEGLYAKMQGLGLGDTVERIQTWVSRIRSFFDGLSEGFKQSKNDFVAFVNELMPAGMEFSDLADMVTRLTGSLDVWSGVGKLVGYTLGALVLGFGLLALSIWAVAKVLGFVYDVIMWTVSGLNLLWEMTKMTAGAFKDWGATMMYNMWDGAKSVMKDFLSWIASKLAYIPGMGDWAKSLQHYADGIEVSGPKDMPSQSGRIAAVRNAATDFAYRSAGQAPPAQQPVIIENHTTVELDGMLVGTAISRYNADQRARSNE